MHQEGKKMHLVCSELLKYILDLKIKGGEEKPQFTATRLLCQFCIFISLPFYNPSMV